MDCDGDICFGKMGNALAQFRVESAPHWDGLLAPCDGPRAHVPLSAISTKAPAYDRALDLPRLLPAVAHWLVFTYGPEFTAAAWREWLRCEINAWALTNEFGHSVRLAASDEISRPALLEHAGAVKRALDAERTIQRMLCELEIKRGEAL